jgi:hypothetical protein
MLKRNRKWSRLVPSGARRLLILSKSCYLRNAIALKEQRGRIAVYNKGKYISGEKQRKVETKTATERK